MSSDNPKQSRKSKDARSGEADALHESASPTEAEAGDQSVPGGSARNESGGATVAGDQEVGPESPLEDSEADEIDARLEAILEEVPDPFADALRQRDEYLDDLRRLQAEFENYRKRVARQSEELTDRATAAVLERILPALDALDLARGHAGDPADETARQLASALAQITSLLRDALAKDGLDRIDEVGVEFDPAVHDAVAHEPADDDTHGVVVAEVLRAGYRLKGRVVRPAMVKVRG